MQEKKQEVTTDELTPRHSNHQIQPVVADSRSKVFRNSSALVSPKSKSISNVKPGDEAQQVVLASSASAIGCDENKEEGTTRLERGDANRRN